MRSSALVFVTLAVLTAGLAFLALKPQAAHHQKISLGTVEKFAQWRRQYGRLYATPAEGDYRLRVFADQLDFVAASNADYEAAIAQRGKKLSGPMFEMNQFGDLSNEEFSAQYTGGRAESTEEYMTSSVDTQHPVATGAFPPSLDYMLKSKIPFFEPKVREQGPAGACWAFAALTEIERALYYRTRTYIDLSPQELLDCERTFIPSQGGFPSSAFNYAKNYGVHKLSDYPYLAKYGMPCKANLPGAIRFPEFGEARVSPFSTKYAAMLSTELVHPTVSVYADGKFKFLSKISDEYDVSLSGECSYRTTHVVVLREEIDRQAWILNSWGAGWGFNGHKRLITCSDSNLWGANGLIIHPWSL